MRVVDVNWENVDDFIMVCIPEAKRNHPAFQEGWRIKKDYLRNRLAKNLPCGKIAYLGDEPVGMIQFLSREEAIEIQCIFASKYQGQGIGTSLLKNLITDLQKPLPYLNYKTPKGIFTYAFETGAGYPQHLFYQKNGFKPVSQENPYLLYFPLEKDWVYEPPLEKEYQPLPEDKNQAIIFYQPNCPWSIYFTEMTEEKIKEIAKNIPIRRINREEEKEEVAKRGNVPYLLVNGKPIRTFVLDQENFLKEVREAWQG